MAVAVSAGLLPEPDPDEAAEMMVLAEESLGYHGLSRYEVANYAESREHESRHNTAYWTGRPYAGLGPGAHGMLDAATARAVGLLSDERARMSARVRYGNAASIADWLVGTGDTLETLTARGGAPRGRDARHAPRPAACWRRDVDRGRPGRRAGIARRATGSSSSAAAPRQGARWRDHATRLASRQRGVRTALAGGVDRVRGTDFASRRLALAILDC